MTENLHRQTAQGSRKAGSLEPKHQEMGVAQDFSTVLYTQMHCHFIRFANLTDFQHNVW